GATVVYGTAVVYGATVVHAATFRTNLWVSESGQPGIVQQCQAGGMASASAVSAVAPAVWRMQPSTQRKCLISIVIELKMHHIDGNLLDESVVITSSI
ncbi:MAG: hypothetical protein NWR61_09705, partial [Pseudomonadales bacterium]|nr:hypothetical protein [Pseudomonadales bacterium]